jgi:hypothetical protein
MMNLYRGTALVILFGDPFFLVMRVVVVLNVVVVDDGALVFPVDLFLLEGCTFLRTPVSIEFSACLWSDSFCLSGVTFLTGVTMRFVTALMTSQH